MRLRLATHCYMQEVVIETFAHSVRRRLLLDLSDGHVDPHDPEDELVLREERVP